MIPGELLAEPGEIELNAGRRTLRVTVANSGATVTTAPANGATPLVLTCTTGETVTKGDKFSIGSVLPVNNWTKRTFGTDNKTFTIAAAGTGSLQVPFCKLLPVLIALSAARRVFTPNRKLLSSLAVAVADGVPLGVTVVALRGHLDASPPWVEGV